jgi:hypothetical protein
VHIFGAAGSYKTCLVVVDQYGLSSPAYCQTITVVASPTSGASSGGGQSGAGSSGSASSGPGSGSQTTGGTGNGGSTGGNGGPGGGDLDAAPMAQVAADSQAPGGSLVTLDASASLDPDGDALQFTWTQWEGPAVTLLDAHSARPTFIMPAAEGATFRFAVEVSDGTLGDVATQVVGYAAPVAPHSAAVPPSGDADTPPATDAGGGAADEPATQAGSSNGLPGPAWLPYVMVLLVAGLLIAVLVVGRRRTRGGTDTSPNATATVG